jgi:hypothetical protein
MNQNFA